MKSFLRNNGLSLAFIFLFLASWVGMSVVGHRQHDEEQTQHGQPGVSYGAYLRSGEFIESSAENWESEFLQMAALIWLTRFLRQRGSEMSKPIDEETEQDKDPREEATLESPGAVLRGGWMLQNEELAEHGQLEQSLMAFAGSSTFWFQSLQNWQSEFLACAAIILLSIVLRQRGSPESKPVHAPHGATGSEAEE